MRRPLVLLFTLVGLFGARRAAAIPAFARKYGAPCGLCHDQVYPVLNDVGRRFKEDGYQLDEPAERAYREASTLRPNPDEPLLLLNQVPLAMRVQSRLTGAVDSKDAIGNNPIMPETAQVESLGISLHVRRVTDQVIFDRALRERGRIRSTFSPSIRSSSWSGRRSTPTSR